jgi:hypothetical protein
MTFDNQNNLVSVGTNTFQGNTIPIAVTYWSTQDYNALTQPSKDLQAQMPNQDQNLFTYNAQPVCFHENTLILCKNKNDRSSVDQWIPVQKLKQGDLVKTFQHGYRPIACIGHHQMFNHPVQPLHCMYQMKPLNEIDKDDLQEIHFINEFPEKHLMVTGGHSMLVNNLGKYKKQNDDWFGGNNKTPIIDGKYLLLAAVSNAFVQQTQTIEPYTYYHFALESESNVNDPHARFGVWADGILVETTSKYYFENMFPK